eukprot:CAMPEP_0203694510 /NCGR_PEP_ID=MMETSP0091-20130426/6216_1 /ASSEMBLY_ACC=CAM_ASM_001089 /TAXON_ID=426623 /ORGANISM="Chaetoceros affinis, Strain CCMP159" /LENGTH=53 /DNA_ID=CAMNT_0050565867 /DNA_START=98 /DNA_END=255 /DNA_ORIENTATION=+
MTLAISLGSAFDNVSASRNVGGSGCGDDNDDDDVDDDVDDDDDEVVIYSFRES